MGPAAAVVGLGAAVHAAAQGEPAAAVAEAQLPLTWRASQIMGPVKHRCQLTQLQMEWEFQLAEGEAPAAQAAEAVVLKAPLWPQLLGVAKLKDNGRVRHRG